MQEEMLRLFSQPISGKYLWLLPNQVYLKMGKVDYTKRPAKKKHPRQASARNQLVKIDAIGTYRVPDMCTIYVIYMYDI